MQLRVGCEFGYQAGWPTPAVMLVQPHGDAPHRVVRETWEAAPALAPHEYRDSFGNRCQRFVLPAGATTLRYDAVVEVSDQPDEVDPAAPQVPRQQPQQQQQASAER